MFEITASLLQRPNNLMLRMVNGNAAHNGSRADDYSDDCDLDAHRKGSQVSISTLSNVASSGYQSFAPYSQSSSPVDLSVNSNNSSQSNSSNSNAATAAAGGGCVVVGGHGGVTAVTIAGGQQPRGSGCGDALTDANANVLSGGGGAAAAAKNGLPPLAFANPMYQNNHLTRAARQARPPRQQRQRSCSSSSDETNDANGDVTAPPRFHQPHRAPRTNPQCNGFLRNSAWRTAASPYDHKAAQRENYFNNNSAVGS